ncbi:hypothetical protein [Photorhabdus laumondii]|uniref:hypothetical protein n=1 Tax=Photorhabdus laumondii TaxID=2218628 RepID=UPI003314F252
MTVEHIPPSEQIYLLNQELVQNADSLTGPAITVGGQAVRYWVNTYLHKYSKDNLPNEVFITSVDVDYVTKRNNVENIARAFNVEPHYNNPLDFPSIAICLLTDKDTKTIKEHEGRLFSNPDNNDECNLVDIIDRPAGFEHDDLSGDKLYLNTERFMINAAPGSHELVRILNPIACIRSRLANIVNKVKDDIEVEKERIRSLMIPTYYFLLEKLEHEDFRTARKYVEDFGYLLQERSRRHCLVKYGIELHKVLESLQVNLSEHRDDYELPDMFLDEELRRMADHHKNQYIRLRAQLQLDQ